MGSTIYFTIGTCTFIAALVMSICDMHTGESHFHMNVYGFLFIIMGLIKSIKEE